MSGLQLMLSLLCLLNHHMCFELPLPDCWTAKYDILISLDCRDEISFQYEIYSSLHKYFSSNSLNQVSLITESVNSYIRIKNFHEKYSDDHQDRINKYGECPSDFSYMNIIQSTERALDKGRREAKKLGFVIILANFKSPEINIDFVDAHERWQNSHNSTLRFFIIINLNRLNIKESIFFIYDKHWNKGKTSLIKSLGRLCSGCNSDQITFISSDKKYKKCYSLGNSTATRSMSDARSECKGVFDLIDFDSKEELNFVRSMLIKHLLKYRMSSGAVYIKQTVYKSFYLKPKIHNAYTIDPYKDLCTVWIFKSSVTVMLNSSVINETSFKDQWLPVGCLKEIEVLKLCEIDLSPIKVFNSLPPIYNLPYKKAKFGEPTIVPKNYFSGFLKEINYFNGYLYHIGKTAYVPITCSADNNLDFLCQHILKCHSDDNYRSSFCNARVQYIYKHSLLTEYYNYQVVNISRLLIDRPMINISNQLHETNKSVQPNIKILNDSILQLQDYLFSEKVDIVPCQQFDKNKRNLQILNQQENFKLMENYHFVLDYKKKVSNCLFSRSVADQCPVFENGINCSDVVCPANFIKCPGSYCVFLGEELRNKNPKCYYLESAESNLSRHFHCSLRLKSTFKRTCISKELPDILQSFNDNYACDFSCSNGFKCFQGLTRYGLINNTSLRYKVFEKRIDILNINDNYRIHPEEIPFLSLLDHAELYAPECKINDVYQIFQDLDISQLVSLDLSFNNITSKDLDTISSMKLLRSLNVSHNPSFNIDTDIYLPTYLEYIDFTYTNVDCIPSATLEKLVYLKYLHLSYTKIKNFKSVALKAPFELRETVLQHQIKTIKFNNQTIPTVLEYSDYNFCSAQVTGPHVTGPQVTGSKMTGPQVTGQQMTGPKMTDPQVTDPQMTGPNVTRPQVTGPQMTGPNVTDPKVTGPQLKGPQVTGPQITGPQITGPQVTGPQMTGPHVTGSQVTVPQMAGSQVTGSQVSQENCTSKNVTQMSSCEGLFGDANKRIVFILVVLGAFVLIFS